MQIRASSTAHGLQLPGADSKPQRFARHQTAPNQYKRAALRRVSDLPGVARLDHPINRIDPMNTQANAIAFCIVLAGYLTAGLMGVAFVQSAAENSLQHSGTQRYVRVVR